MDIEDLYAVGKDNLDCDSGIRNARPMPEGCDIADVGLRECRELVGLKR